MNPDTTVFIPTPFSEKPKEGRYRLIQDNDHITSQSYSFNGIWEQRVDLLTMYTHWLKPVKLSEITTSQPVSEWQLCPKCKGDVCWQDTIVDGQNISITACTMCKGEGKILPPAQPVKSNEDILVKALDCIANPLKFLKDEAEQEGCELNGYMAAQIASDPNWLKQQAEQALSSYRTSLQGLSGKEIGHYEYDKENEDFKIVVKGEEQAYDEGEVYELINRAIMWDRDNKDESATLVEWWEQIKITQIK